jgi:iron complex transport system substrate-binding protein
MRLILVSLLLIHTAILRAEVLVSDDEMRQIKLSSPAKRIVTLSPHATELMFGAGAGGRVVGADEYSDYPAIAKRIPRIGRAGALDIERIAALKPDLVIGWGSGNVAGQIAALRRLGLTVFISEPRTIEDVASTLRRFGALAGTEKYAEVAAKEFEGKFATLRQRYGSRPPVSVFYQIWDRPLMTVNGQHLINSVIEVCGGRNVFAGLTQLAPTVDLEAVLLADPQAIVGSAEASRTGWLDDWKRWPRLSAVRSNNLFDVPPDLIQRHTVRLAEGATKLCDALESARGRLQTGK